MTQNQKSITLLITGGPVVTMNSAGQIFDDGAVAIDGAEIVLVGPRSEVEAQVAAQSTLDAAGQIIMPGLVNTHTHAAMTLFRGFADDINLEPWLKKILQIENRYATAENVRIGSALAFIEMIQSGTTTAADMYWQRVETTDLAREVGFRLVNGPSFMDFIGPDGIQPTEREAAARDFLARYQNDALIECCMQVHATYTVPTHLLEKARQMQEEFDLLFVTHASETRAEVATIVERYGQTPIQYLDSLGLLGPKTLLAHGVHLRDDEIELLARRGASVAHCPESNLKLGSGMARAADMLAAGVNVALGTDGAATNNDLDMWGEMQTAALLQKGLLFDSTALPASQALQMATVNGARALGLGDKIGSLEPGKRADIILVDFDRPHLTPLFDLYSHLVYAVNKADVQTVIINGQMVMQNRQVLTLDETAIKTEARRIAQKFEII